DLAWINAEILRPRAHRANRPLRILQRCRMAIALAAMAIVANEAGDSMLVQPAPDLVSLMVHRQAAIPATGTDHDADSIQLLRQVNDQRRLVLRFVPFGAGRAARPKQLSLRLR